MTCPHCNRQRHPAISTCPGRFLSGRRRSVLDSPELLAERLGRVDRLLGFLPHQEDRFSSEAERTAYRRGLDSRRGARLR